MARKFLTAIDLSELEILNARLQNLATPPTASDGRIFFHTGLGKVGIGVGGSFIYLGEGGAPQTVTLDDVTDTATRLAMTPAERTKLGGSASGATANSTDAQLRDRSTHTGTQSADTVVDGTTNKAFTAAEKTKLAGTAAGATANDTNAALRDRSSHTGTQAHTTISDFDAGVQENRLDQMAAPTGAVALNSQKITGLADPTASSDAATKNYVDATVQGLDIKESVRVATTANITLSAPQTIDGVAVVAGNRVLVKNQTTASANGIYVVAAGAWTRALDFDSPVDASPGSFVFVEEGTAQQDTGWVLTTNGAVVIGTTSLAFTQFSGAGSWTAGTGLTQSGTTMNVIGGNGITVAADAVAVDPAVVVRKYATTLATSATLYTVTHSLNTLDVQVVVRTVATGELVETDIIATGVNTITVGFAVAPAANTYRVIVQG